MNNIRYMQSMNKENHYLILLENYKDVIIIRFYRYT
jgi:hypothetical protein